MLIIQNNWYTDIIQGKLVFLHPTIAKKVLQNNIKSYYVMAIALTQELP